MLDVASRVIVVEQGKIVADGPKEVVLQQLKKARCGCRRRLMANNWFKKSAPIPSCPPPSTWNTWTMAPRLSADDADPRQGAALGLLPVFMSAIVWAAWAELDEVTVGQGKVIPSRQLQVIQNLEGGSSRRSSSRRGHRREGQPLLRIDDTASSPIFANGSRSW